MGNVRTLEDSDVHVKCSQGCGFVVHDEYYATKGQFSPGYCARCGAVIRLVKPYTDEEAVGWEMDMRSGRIRREVGED